jgi:iron(III) transport system substrate-binding protein
MNRQQPQSSRSGQPGGRLTRMRITPARARRGLTGSALLALVLVLAVIARGSSSGGRSLVLYNGQHPQVTTELVSAFEKQTHVTVEVRTNDGIVLADQLLQEGSSSPADVYLTENSPELEDLEQHGLLAKLEPVTLSQVSSRYESQSGVWAGVALRISALAYDPKLIGAAALPKSLLELAEPRWKGEVALAPTDSDFVPLVGAVIATYGKQAATRWLAGLKRNGSLYQDDESVVAAVNKGDVAVGVINHYYWYRLRLEVGASGMHSLLYFFPNHNVGSLENISGAGVLKSSKHLREAQEFVKFLLSPIAQEILAHGYDFEYPLRPGIAPNAQITPLAKIKPAELSPTVLGNDQQASQLIQESGLA